MQSVVVDQGKLIRDFGRTLAETEQFAPDRLRKYQLSLLANLLSHAAKASDFYRQRLGFDAASPAAIEAAWSSIPILTRVEAAANRDRLFSHDVPPYAGATFAGTTSGSTATPLHYRRSQIAVLAAGAMVERMMRWWGVDRVRSVLREPVDVTFKKVDAIPRSTSGSSRISSTVFRPVDASSSRPRSRLDRCRIACTMVHSSAAHSWKHI